MIYTIYMIFVIGLKTSKNYASVSSPLPVLILIPILILFSRL